MADYEGVLHDLRDKRAMLYTELARLDSAIKALEPLVSSEPETGPGSTSTSVRQQFAGIATKDAAAAYLRMAGRSLSTRQLFGGLEARGFNNNIHTLYNTMHRYTRSQNPMFVRDGRLWALANSGGE